MLSANRNTPERAGEHFLVLAVAEAKHIFAGGLVCLLDGFAVPGAAAARLIAMGRAEEEIDNTNGNDGDVTVKVRRGIFFFANSADADEIGDGDVMKTAYIVDDQTVAKTSNGGARSIAGRIVAVEANGVWVFVGEQGADRKVYLSMPTLDLKAADNGVSRMRSPVAGKITAISGVCGTAVTGADATAQGKIAGVNITGGLLTWALAGAAIGQGQSAMPTDDNTVAVGDIISFATGGGGTQTGNADIVIEITLA
jgi:hypothetical protein